MLLQNEDIGDTFDQMFWHLKIRCTTKCNMYCKHCYAAAEDYPYEPDCLTNFEWAERLIKSPHIRFIHLQGGEPTLAFDTMRQCRELGRKYGKPVAVFTNGKLLFEDEDYRKRFTEEICPDMLIVSFNRYLEEQTDQAEVVNTLAEFYKDHPTIKFGSTAIIDNTNMPAMKRFMTYGKWPPYDPSLYPEIESKLRFDYWKFQLPLGNASRAVRSGVGARDCAKCTFSPVLRCEFSPVLMPSGFLLADCGSGDLRKTTLGYIEDFGDDPIEYLYQHKVSHTSASVPHGVAVNNFFELCERMRSIHCLDKYPPHTLPEEEYTKRLSIKL